MKENSDISAFLKAVLWGIAATVASAVILMLAGAFVALASSDPNTLVIPIGCASLGISIIVGGVISAILGERMGFSAAAVSLTAGAFEIVLMLVLSLVPLEPYMQPGILLKVAIYAVVLLLSFFGGMMGRPRKRRSRYPKRPKR